MFPKLEVRGSYRVIGNYHNVQLYYGQKKTKLQKEAANGPLKHLMSLALMKKKVIMLKHCFKLNLKNSGSLKNNAKGQHT